MLCRYIKRIEHELTENNENIKGPSILILKNIYDININSQCPLLPILPCFFLFFLTQLNK